MARLAGFEINADFLDGPALGATPEGARTSPAAGAAQTLHELRALGAVLRERVAARCAAKAAAVPAAAACASHAPGAPPASGEHPCLDSLPGGESGGCAPGPADVRPERFVRSDG